MVTHVQSFVFPAVHELETKRELAKSVKPGDIVFTKFTEKFLFPVKIDASISVLQKVVNGVQRKKGVEGIHRITHTAIVVAVDDQKGKILVAEAMPTGKKNELRVIDLLCDSSMVLTDKEPYEYLILRMDEKKAGSLPEKAARIADNLATPASYLRQNAREDMSKGQHRFSYAEGFIAIFSHGSSRIRTQSYAKRLFEKVLDEHLRRVEGRQKASGGAKGRKFFCSYFATHVYQQAELSEHFDRIKQLKGISEGLEKIEQLPEGKARTSELNRWASRMAKEHGKKIGNMVENFALDPKYTSPEQLMEFLQKGNLFRPIVHLVPPTSTPNQKF